MLGIENYWGFIVAGIVLVVMQGKGGTSLRQAQEGR